MASSAAGIAPLKPIEGASAWIGATLKQQPDSWIYHLSDAEIAELDDATRATRRSSLDVADIRRQHFPLPHLGPTLERLRDEVLNGSGFVLIRGMPVHGRSMLDCATAYWGIGAHVGNARSQNAMGHLLGHVRDLGLSAEKDPNVRIYQTTERQTIHTDWCDIVAQLCLRTAQRGGYSSIVSSMSIYNRMVAERPDLAERLCLPFAMDRRGEVPPGARPFTEIPVFSHHEGLLSVLYSRRYIDSAQRFPEARRLTAADVEALDHFDTLANDPDLRLDMEFQPGDVQLLHNHTILHDRTAYEDWPEPARKRHLLRLWLAPAGARPLPPAFAERFDGIAVGDRGGIRCAGTRLHAPLEAV
jgi:hypothetical protein